ncbi:MAG: hypothetical protein RL590_465 [Actinomycetota bacterium]|jgi:iron(III) transport system substrate-binding protein
MSFKNRLLGLSALIFACAALVSGCSSNPSAEQSLTIYSGRAEEYIAPFIEQFTAETGIKLDIRYGDSAALAAQLLEEGENSPADLFLSQDAGSLGAVSNSDLLQRLPSRLLTKVDAKYQSSKQDWIGVTGRVRVFAYSPERVSNLPESVDDLTKPEWKGRIGIAPTNSSFQAFVTAMILNRGEAATQQWLTGIKQNNPKLYEKNSQIVEAIDAGQLDLGLVNHYYVWEVSEELGRTIKAKIDFFAPGDIGNMVNVSGAGILKSSGKMDLAQRFIEFLLSDGIQKAVVDQTHEYSLVFPDLTPSGVPAFREIKSPAVDLTSLSDLKRTQNLLIKVGLI